MQDREKFEELLSELTFTFTMGEEFFEKEIKSDFYLCLPALLAGLKWEDDVKKLIDSFPPLSSPIDAIDILNIMANLGFIGHRNNINLSNLEERIFPCLALNLKEYPVVILSRKGHEITYFDPKEKLISDQSFKNKKLKVFNFTKNKNHTGQDDEIVNPKGKKPLIWFMSILTRFKPAFIQLLITSFVINVIGLLSPLFVMTAYDKVIGGKDPQTLVVLITAAVLVLGLDVFLRRSRAKNLSWLSSRVNYIINTALFRKILNLSLYHTDQMSVSSQMSKLRLFTPIKDFMASTPAAMFIEFPFIIIYLVLILTFSPILVLVPVAAMILYLIYAFYILNLLEIHKEKSSDLKGLKQEILQESVEKLDGLKKLTDLEVWQNRFKEESGKESMENFKLSMLMGKIETASYLLTTMAGVATLVVGINLVWAEMLTVGKLVATMMIVWRIISPLQLICLSIGRFRQFYNIIIGIHKFLSIDSDKFENDHENLFPVKKEGNISLEAVGIKFANRSTAVINGLNLEIKHGDFVTLTGPTGSGKRVLLKIVGGFYPPQMGTVRINGVDMRQMDNYSIRSLISIVDENPFLIEGTILENLRLANYTASEEMVIEALKEAELFSFILEFEKGLHQELDQESLKYFSNEHLFKLSLTRAFLKDTPINILESLPYSIINTKHRERFLRKLKRRMRHKTLIISTRDKDIINNSDLLIFQMGGNQIFTGPPKQLLEALEKSDKHAV